MALINCPECGKEISDKAQTCPNCGLNLVWKEKIDRLDEELDHNFQNYINNLQPPKMITSLDEISQYRNNTTVRYLVSIIGFGGGFISLAICLFGMDIERGFMGYHFVMILAAASLLAIPIYLYSHDRKLLKKEQERIQYEIDNFDDTKETKIENYSKILILQRERLIRDIVDPQNIQKTQITTNIPHCPICGSTKIKKISSISKAASVALIGIFAIGKVGKQWHCNQCNSNF